MKRSLRWLLLLLVLAAGSLVWLQQEGQTGAGGSDQFLETILEEEDTGFASEDGEWE